MIFVPAPAPVSHHNCGLVFPNHVANGEAGFIVNGNLPVGIGEEFGLGAQHLGCADRRLALKSTVFTRRNSGGAFFSERQADEDAVTSMVNLIGYRRTHRKESVARMCGNGHQRGGYRGFLASDGWPSRHGLLLLRPWKKPSFPIRGLLKSFAGF